MEDKMNTQELIKIEDDYFINTFTRQPIVLDHGDGCKVTDIDGNEIDFSRPCPILAANKNAYKFLFDTVRTI